MKTGKTLTELAIELERQSETKKDFIASTEVLEMTNTGAMVLEGDKSQEFEIADVAHTQIAARLDIPTKYYQRMRSQAPELLSANVNGWFQQKPERRMVRTLDGQMRAFLSDRYRRLDNYDLAAAVLPVLKDMGEGLKIVSTELTESKMYIKVINERLELEVKQGDVVQAGMVISNSEVGMGSLKVEPLIYRLICTNGLIAQDHSQKRYHVGRNAEEGEAYELFRDETIKADDRAFLCDSFWRNSAMGGFQALAGNPKGVEFALKSLARRQLNSHVGESHYPRTLKSHSESASVKAHRAR